MLPIIGAVIFIAITIYDELGKAEFDRKWKECEETDWNEYYANIS